MADHLLNLHVFDVVRALRHIALYMCLFLHNHVHKTGDVPLRYPTVYLRTLYMNIDFTTGFSPRQHTIRMKEGYFNIQA